MEEMQLREEISAYKKLSNDYDRQLKLVGIELTDLPDDCITLLDKYAEIRTATGLISLDKTYLDQFYFGKSLEYIKLKKDRWRIEKDIRNLEKEIATEKDTNKTLEECLKAAKSKLVSELEMAETKAAIEQRIASLKQKQAKGFKPPSDFNFSELLNKIEILETRKKLEKATTSGRTASLSTSFKPSQ